MKQLLLHFGPCISTNLVIINYSIVNRHRYDRIIVLCDPRVNKDIFFSYFKLKTNIFEYVDKEESIILNEKLKYYTKNEIPDIIQNTPYNKTDYLREIHYSGNKEYINNIKNNFDVHLPEYIINDFNNDNATHSLTNKYNVILKIRQNRLFNANFNKKHIHELYKILIKYNKNLSLYIDSAPVFNDIRGLFNDDTYVFDNLKTESREISIEKDIYLRNDGADVEIIYKSLLEDQLKYIYYCSKLKNIYTFPSTTFYLMNLFN